MLKELLPTIEVAKILKISRVAVFKKIKNGHLPAEKYGRSYLVKTEDLRKYILDRKERDDKKVRKQREVLDKVVKKVVDEYGETLKLLGDE